MVKRNLQKLTGKLQIGSIPVIVLFALMCSFSTISVKAQTLIYSQAFVQSQTATNQCNAWETFRASLLTYSYHTLSIQAGANSSTITCTNPTIIADIALCLRTGITRTWTDGSNVWNVGTCGSGGNPNVTGWELSVNNGNCLCSSGFCVRPCIGNSNWGGQGTTCGAPSQTMIVTFAAGPPCPLPTNVTISAVYSTSVFFNWTAPTGSNGSEFVIDQNASGPTGTPLPTHTTATTASQSGLTPSTTYYLHVRNKCDSPSKSLWETTTFTTLPPCVIPPSINVPSVDTNSATITWQTIVPAVEYDYVIKNVFSMPANGIGASSTTSGQVNFNSLEPGKTYYFFVRAKCLGGDSSAWIADSFYVPLPCRAPEVMFNDLNSSKVVAYWSKPITSYEYDIVNSATQLNPPLAGIKQVNNSYLFPYLDDNKTYYVYARSYCIDHGIRSISPWSEASYKTWATGVDDLEDQTNSLSVYPNPVKDEMVVTITGSVSNDGQVSILDVSGKVLKTLATYNKKKIVVSINDLPSGVYVLKYNNDTRREQVRFNKQ